MLFLVLAESALETVPERLWAHPSVRQHVKRRRKCRFVLLDRSLHHAAMKSLRQNHKRGRPDIVHFSLLVSLGSPLNREGLLKVYIHTIDDHVITVKSEARLPRNYGRFTSLIEQLFEFGRVPPDVSRTPLLTLKHQTLPQLIHEIKPSSTLALSRAGAPKTLTEAVTKLAEEPRPLILVGGFPHGHFSKATIRLADDVFSIDHEMLETWTVVSRAIYEFEHALSIPKKRLESWRAAA